MNQFPARGKSLLERNGKLTKIRSSIRCQIFFRNYVPFLCSSKTYNVDFPRRIKTHFTHLAFAHLVYKNLVEKTQILRNFRFVFVSFILITYVKHHTFVIFLKLFSTLKHNNNIYPTRFLKVRIFKWNKFERSQKQILEPMSITTSKIFQDNSDPKKRRDFENASFPAYRRSNVHNGGRNGGISNWNGINLSLLQINCSFLSRFVYICLLALRI